MSLKRCIQAVSAVLMMILLCAVAAGSLAESGMSVSRFPEGVVEVPQGTEIIIDDTNNVVTIVNPPVDIAAGDTFVVYLQDLPIGYSARMVDRQGNKLVISVEKADKSIYKLLEEEGVVELTPDMYEFIPAPNVTARTVARGSDGLSYSDGKLAMTVAAGDSSVQVYLSDLRLSHSVSAGSISVTLNGNWGIETLLSSSETNLDDFPLGEIRIAGVGKIALRLSIEQSMSVTCKFSGSFSAGVVANGDDGGHATKDFSVIERSVEGQGTISAALKVSAGVDILIAEADIYVEVGIETQYTSQHRYEPVTEVTTHCDDFKIYLFSTIGAEAKYYSILTGKMKT